MKKYLITAILITLSIVTFGQWQIDGDNIYYNNGNVGIGTDNVNHKFEVFDNNSHIFFNDAWGPTWQSFRAAFGIGYLGDGHAGLFIDGADGDFYGMDYCSLIQFNDLSLGLSNMSDSQIDFGVGGDYFSPAHIKMSILHTGNVGIGTNVPHAKLQIADGDIYISDINKGIIMKSPNGQCWKGTISNSGILQFYEITCPELTVSINPNSEILDNIKIYPNPTKNQVEIIIEHQENVTYQLQIMDIKGNIIKSLKINQIQTKVNINDFQSGIYLFKLFDLNSNKTITKRIIKT